MSKRLIKTYVAVRDTHSTTCRGNCSVTFTAYSCVRSSGTDNAGNRTKRSAGKFLSLCVMNYLSTVFLTPASQTAISFTK